MKIKPLFPLVLAFAALTVTTSVAQSYKSAVGARLGYPLSATYKTFISESSALEAYVGFRGYSSHRWISLSGAYLYHSPISGVENLSWYLGGGASVYFWTYDVGFSNPGGSTNIGLQGYLGLDYRLADTPLNISVDWIPTIFLSGYSSGFGGGYGSLALRYILK